MENSSDVDYYYEIACDLVREAIHDQLIGETLWYWEDSEFLGTQKELDTLQRIIADIKNHIG